MMIKRFKDGRDWMFEKRLGMFIHWGLYSLTEVHEQILWRYKYKRREYEKLIGQFNPADFDPDKWIDTARSGNMDFLCFTTKHHDGFCLWYTKETDYNIMNTPFGKDALKQLSDACASRDMDLGLYYSLPDWHHPHYPNRGRHHEMKGPRPGDEPDEEKYLDYVEAQITELLSGYGKITHFFWDVNVAEFHRPEINELIRRLQPGILINDRGPGEGDYFTPERKVPEDGIFSRPTIAIQSTGRESWCYRKDEDYYSHLFLMQSIGKTLAMGGSYQLNIGPDSKGNVGEEDRETLERIGDWYGRIGEAFAETQPCTYMLAEGESQSRYDKVLMTRKENTFYVIACETLTTSGIMLHPFDELPDKATLLNDGREVKALVDVVPWRWMDRPALRLADLPVNEISGEPLVIKLEFNEDFSA